MIWLRSIESSERIIELSSDKWTKTHCSKRTLSTSSWLLNSRIQHWPLNNSMKSWCSFTHTTQTTRKVHFSKFRTSFLAKHRKENKRPLKIWNSEIDLSKTCPWEWTIKPSKLTRVKYSNRTMTANLRKGQNCWKVTLKKIRSLKLGFLLTTQEGTTFHYQTLGRKFGRWFRKRLKDWKTEKKSTKFFRKII